MPAPMSTGSWSLVLLLFFDAFGDRKDMHPAFFFFLLNLWSRFAILAANGSSGRAARQALQGANKAHGMSGAAAQCHNRVERGENESLTVALRTFSTVRCNVFVSQHGGSASKRAPPLLPRHLETPNANSPRTIFSCNRFQKIQL